jgi:hypothetical protein
LRRFQLFVAVACVLFISSSAWATIHILSDVGASTQPLNEVNLQIELPFKKILNEANKATQEEFNFDMPIHKGDHERRIRGNANLVLKRTKDISIYPSEARGLVIETELHMFSRAIEGNLELWWQIFGHWNKVPFSKVSWDGRVNGTAKIRFIVDFRGFDEDWNVIFSVEDFTLTWIDGPEVYINAKNFQNDIENIIREVFNVSNKHLEDFVRDNAEKFAHDEIVKLLQKILTVQGWK